MSTQLFGRKARVIFGQPGEDAPKITDLRIKFKIEKSSEQTPNKAVISVYNMNPRNRARSERSGNLITLDAGYDGSVENLFIGDVTRALTRTEGPDIITEFECGDGQSQYNGAAADISFAPGTTAQSVFDTLREQFGFPKGDQASIPNKVFQNGLTLSGPIRDHFDFLTQSLGLVWSVQNGELQILKKGTTTQDEAIILSPQTGLVGSPKRKDKGGLDIQSLLQPKANPGRALVLQSRFLNGLARILKVTHEGDTHDTPWYSNIEAIQV